MADYLLLIYLSIGFVVNTLFSLPVFFSKEFGINWELWIATCLTWPVTLYKVVKNGLNNSMEE